MLSWIEIDVAAVGKNLEAFRSVVTPGTAVMAVVKANAYGHGIEVVAPVAARHSDWLGVNSLEEALTVRELGIDKPIAILGHTELDNLEYVVSGQFRQVVYREDVAAALSNHARDRRMTARVHLKVETGTHRQGIDLERLGDFVKEIQALPNLDIEGVISHFASADELDRSGREYTEYQAGIFTQAIAIARAAGFNPRYLHIANSAAAFNLDLPECNLVRPGITLYGALPSADFSGTMDLKPVMTLKSRIAMLKWVDPGTSISYARRYTAGERTLVASVPVGYADGYRRSLTNRAEALVRGVRVPVIGTVCMDWIMLNVSAVPEVTVGDEVVLMGCDCNGNRVRAEEIADWSQTIPYEIFCGISKRVPRIYLP